MKNVYTKRVFLWGIVLVIGCGERTDTQVKVVEEHYPNGTLKIQKEAIEDSTGNLINHGKYTSWYENGRKEIEAIYKKGEKHGKFVWYWDLEREWVWSSGTKKMEGIFENGLNIGIWTFYNGNGQKSEQGEYSKGKRHGKWTEFDYHDRKTGEGEYLNGKRHGKWTFWRKAIEPVQIDPSNIIIEVSDIPKDEPKQEAKPDTTLPWHNSGIRVKNDAIRTECEFYEGLKNGIGISWYANGQKAAECSYKDNKRHGKFIKWDSDGNKELEFEYVNGILHGKYVFYQNGKKTEEYEVKQGKFKGLENPFVAYDQEPRPIGGFAAIQKALKFPEIARIAGIEGKVIVHVLVSEKGEVINTKILKSLGHGGCDDAAVEAIRSVQWKPALQKDKPVKVWVAIPVIFKLD